MQIKRRITGNTKERFVVSYFNAAKVYVHIFIPVLVRLCGKKRVSALSAGDHHHSRSEFCQEYKDCPGDISHDLDLITIGCAGHFHVFSSLLSLYPPGVKAILEAINQPSTRIGTSPRVRFKRSTRTVYG